MLLQYFKQARVSFFETQYLTHPLLPERINCKIATLQLWSMYRSVDNNNNEPMKRGLNDTYTSIWNYLRKPFFTQGSHNIFLSYNSVAMLKKMFNNIQSIVPLFCILLHLKCACCLYVDDISLKSFVRKYQRALLLLQWKTI